MRILFVNAVGFVGGAETWIVHLARRLVARGHAIEVVHDPHSPLGDLARAVGARAWTPPGALRGVVRSAAALAREIRRGRYDVVVSTSRSDLKLAGFAARVAGHAGVVARLNSGWSPSEPVVTRGSRWRRHRWYHRHLVHLAATNSLAGKADIVARGYLPEDRVTVIYNGVDAERFDPDRTGKGRFRAELGIGGDAELVVSLARFAPGRGLEAVVDALAALASQRPDLHAVMIGSCRSRHEPFRAELVARAAKLPGGERVRFLGSRDDVPRVLADADVLVRVLSTEGLANVALEAMAMRVPVVAADVSGMPEVIEDGHTGRLVPPNDVPAIVAAVEDLLDLPEAARRTLVERARDLALERFGMERMVDDYEALFERARKERRPS
ncbi:MAG TPA: glycosyltransferase family 4 protein [Gemmatimonadota bacterium]|nr:glycosyltransferase family 4 protein [Gemmatimonadota bacterium]